VVPYNVPKEGLQILGDIHLGWEGCIVTSFLARGMAVSCGCLPLFRLSYKKNVNINALQWPFHAAHTSMDTVQAITKFGQSVLLFPQYSLDLTPWDCKLFGCVKTSCEVTIAWMKKLCFGCRRRARDWVRSLVEHHHLLATIWRIIILVYYL
jgi:hypothetical protein